MVRWEVYISSMNQMMAVLGTISIYCSWLPLGVTSQSLSRSTGKADKLSQIYSLFA